MWYLIAILTFVQKKKNNSNSYKTIVLISYLMIIFNKVKILNSYEKYVFF